MKIATVTHDDDGFDRNSDYEAFKAIAESEGRSGDDGVDKAWELFKSTAGNFLRMAYWLRYAEEKGADLAATKLKLNGLYISLRRIAYGQLRAELLVRYCDNLTLVKRLGTLPIVDQDRIIEDGGVRMLVHGSDGTPSHAILDPGDMTPDQVRQVFAPDHIRSDEQQASIIYDRRAKNRRPVPPQEMYGGIIEVEAGVVRSEGPISWTLEQMEEIVRIMRKGRRKRTG